MDQINLVIYACMKIYFHLNPIGYQDTVTSSHKMNTWIKYVLSDDNRISILF